jgi:HD-GYP domain-containing protein (c-di-GMP phosphodiesterase class II)
VTTESLRQIAPGDMTVLLRVSLALSRSLELDTVLQTAIEGAVEVLGLDSGAIYLSAGPDRMRLGATTPPLPPDFPDEFRVMPLAEHPHIARANASAAPAFLADARTADLTDAERAVCESRSLRSILYVPLCSGPRVLGTFIVGSSTRLHDFTENDVALCQVLSSHIALAIVNAQLFEEAQRAAAELIVAYDATLEGWSAALEMRDMDTCGHTERAAMLAVDIAASLGVPEADLGHIRRGALLNDIGKMVVPDAILNKPGPLDDEEWAVMRKHPEYAYEFLSRIGFLAPALDIPYCHHERWDGSGYPRGLAGEDIPLSARVFSVIDVYDALTSDRPYRSAWTRDAALEYIVAQAGVQFDPHVVALFTARMAQTLADA